VAGKQADCEKIQELTGISRKKDSCTPAAIERLDGCNPFGEIGIRRCRIAGFDRNQGELKILGVERHSVVPLQTFAPGSFDHQVTPFILGRNERCEKIRGILTFLPPPQRAGVYEVAEQPAMLRKLQRRI